MSSRLTWPSWQRRRSSGSGRSPRRGGGRTRPRPPGAARAARRPPNGATRPPAVRPATPARGGVVPRPAGGGFAGLGGVAGSGALAPATGSGDANGATSNGGTTTNPGSGTTGQGAVGAPPAPTTKPRAVTPSAPRVQRGS